MATVSPPPATEVALTVEPDGQYEVIDGRIVATPPMGALEGMIASKLGQVLGSFTGANRIGQVVVEVLFQIDPIRGLNRRPDVAFVSHERWPIDRRLPRGVNAWEVVPDLAVEIVSPSNFADEIVDKLAEYFRAGARLVWVVYPSQDLVYAYDAPKSVRILSAGDDLDGGAVLPGFRMPVAALFGGAAGGTGQGGLSRAAG